VSNRFFAVLAIVAVAAGLYVIFGYSGDGSEGADATRTAAAKVPASRAQMPIVVLPRADGGSFSSAPLRGKSPVVVSFFATW
jgi:cytochrome oxidase Cu insertion factor (SCO1/SenC/PrrC family)